MSALTEQDRIKAEVAAANAKSDALIGRVEAFARSASIAAHASGRGDEARLWLDLLRMIEADV